MTQNSPPNGASPQETADAPQPEESAFSGNRPEAQIPATPGAQKFLAALALVAPLTLLALAAALAWPAFLGNSQYCPHEAAGILAYHQSAAKGFWLSPMSAGLAHWPGFFWLAGGLEALLDASAPQWAHMLFPLAAFCGAGVCLLAVWGLCRAAGLNSTEALAGSLVLLCSPLFAPLVVLAAPEGLAAGLALISLAFLCRGWQKERAVLLLPTGFVLAGLAGLTGGLFYLAVPLAASVLFLFWRGAFLRAQGLDGLLGFVLLLALAAVWLGCLMLWKQPEGYLRSLSQNLLLRPDAASLKPMLMAAVGLLPWTAVVACVSWARVLRTAPQDLRASRGEKSGTAFLWLALLAGSLLSLMAPAPVGAALCLAALAAPLLGKAVVRLSGTGNRLFALITALLFLHVGMALAAAHFGFTLDRMTQMLRFTLDPSLREALLGLTALPVLGGLCIIAALILARLARRQTHGGGCGVLLACTVLTILLAQPAHFLLAPGLHSLPQTSLLGLETILTPAQPAESATSTPENAQPAPHKNAPVAPDNGDVSAVPPVEEKPAQENPAQSTPQAAPDPQPEQAEQQEQPEQAHGDARMPDVPNAPDRPNIPEAKEI